MGVQAVGKPPPEQKLKIHRAESCFKCFSQY